MTVQGNVDLLLGSILELEIGGTQAGVSHDLLDVEGAGTVALNGRVVPQLSGGFVPQPTDTFTVATSNVPLGGSIQNISSGRVSTANGRASFSVALTNGGNDLQLGDFQTFSAFAVWWRNTHFSLPEQMDPFVSGDDKDPDFDGLKNLAEFAFNLNPRGGNAGTGLPSVTVTPGGARIFTFLRYTGGTTSPDGYDAEGIRYIVERSGTLSGWSPVKPGDPEVVSFTMTPSVDGFMETVRIELAPSVGTKQFLRMHIERL